MAALDRRVSTARRPCQKSEGARKEAYDLGPDCFYLLPRPDSHPDRRHGFYPLGMVALDQPTAVHGHNIVHDACRIMVLGAIGLTTADPAIQTAAMDKLVYDH